MTDDTLAKVLQRVDEALAHKERVSSNALADIRDRTLARIEELRADMNRNFDEMEKSVTRSIASAIKDLKKDMEIQHIKLENTDTDHEKRIAIFERIAWIVISTLTVAATGALFVLK